MVLYLNTRLVVYARKAMEILERELHEVGEQEPPDHGVAASEEFLPMELTLVKDITVAVDVIDSLGLELLY